MKSNQGDKNRFYQVLIQYLLKSKNLNEDGSPAVEDGFYKVIAVKAPNISEVMEAAKKQDTEYFITRSHVLQSIISEPDYMEDSLEIENVLSGVGHAAKEYLE